AMTTYTYHKDSNKIVEKATMKEPEMKYKLSGEVRYGSCICPFCGRHSSSSLIDMKHECIWSEYQQHIASLKQFDCHPSCKDVWSDGEDVTRKYELQQWCNNIETLNGVDTFVSKYKPGNQLGCRCCHIYAYPLTTQESED